MQIYKKNEYNVYLGWKVENLLHKVQTHCLSMGYNEVPVWSSREELHTGTSLQVADSEQEWSSEGYEGNLVLIHYRASAGSFIILSGNRLHDFYFRLRDLSICEGETNYL